MSPRGIYTSGKGSSAVGLTAYITRDPESRQLVLERYFVLSSVLSLDFAFAVYNLTLINIEITLSWLTHEVPIHPVVVLWYLVMAEFAVSTNLTKCQTELAQFCMKSW